MLYITPTLLLAAITPWITNVAPGIILKALESFGLRHILSTQLASAHSLLSLILGDPMLHIDVNYLGNGIGRRLLAASELSVIPFDISLWQKAVHFHHINGMCRLPAI